MRTDGEAEEFVNAFTARRGGLAFRELVKHRGAIAEKFFGDTDAEAVEMLAARW